MSVRTLITNAGTDYTADVRTNKALLVSVIPTFPQDIIPAEVQQKKYFTTLFMGSTTAISSGLNTNASVSSVLFQVTASLNSIISIKQVRFTMEGSNLDITSIDSRRFGAATSANTPLTNGINFIAIQEGITTNIFYRPLKILADYYRFADPGLISDVAAVATGVDFFMGTITFLEPVVLLPDSTDALTITIRDNLSAISLFEVQAYGTREILR
ncbi:MAG: hypothetical protein WC761_01190 [Candidatus Paceibacterota bacterium]|jgi:hypothetical protein